jgi:hypothetical protein
MSNHSLDIFEEASKEVLQNSNSTVVVKTIQDCTNSKSDKKLTPLEAKNWSELQHAFETYHVKRFNRVLQQLPDREFVRTFLKVAPFFKINASKKPVDPNVTVNNITITVNRSERAEESKIIEIK